MTPDSISSIPVKPRVLIADDSRIVRAALIKRIEGIFEFREALDGEQAWETLLLDPSIRVVITDLTMPRLDGYGLLQRIRGSRIGRIRDLPVVVVSGSDEQEERARARAAGATDLITKGIATPQLLSRLEVLSKLVNTQREFERGLEALVRGRNLDPVTLTSAALFWTQAQALLAEALKAGKNFVVLNVCVGIRHQALDGFAPSPPALVVDAVGQLLRRTVRQTDLVAATGEAEFTLASGSFNFDSARCFAERVCHAIARAHLMSDERMSFIASCGVAALGDEGIDAKNIDLRSLYEQAHKRALTGLHAGLTGVVGRREELAFERGEQAVGALASAQADTRQGPDLATLLQWMKEGRQREVLPYLDRLSDELKPLVELMQQQLER
jgi:two-component system cell cycle response regulator